MTEIPEKMSLTARIGVDGKLLLLNSLPTNAADKGAEAWQKKRYRDTMGKKPENNPDSSNN